MRVCKCRPLADWRSDRTRPFLFDETSKRTRFGEAEEALDELLDLAVDAARGEPLNEDARCRPTATVDFRPPLLRLLVKAAFVREGPAKS